MAKTLCLYAIMITGCIWEREVFGRYLFAPAFYWEDVFSMLVLALHTAYLAALLSGALDAHGLMLLALAAYAAYVINAGQFVLKLRSARREDDGRVVPAHRPAAARPAARECRCIISAWWSRTGDTPESGAGEGHHEPSGESVQQRVAGSRQESSTWRR